MPDLMHLFEAPDEFDVDVEHSLWRCELERVDVVHPENLSGYPIAIVDELGKVRQVIQPVNIGYYPDHQTLQTKE